MLIRLVLLCLLLYSTVTAALPSTLRVERLGAAHGLSQNSVNDVALDSQGFLWIATFDGLNRFDGYNFKHFTHHPDSTSGLSSSVITALHVDRKGILWIGTRSGGLNRYDPATGQIIYFRHTKGNKRSLSHDDIMAIDEDSEGNLWLGTLGGGVNHFNVTTEEFTHYLSDLTRLDSLSDDRVSKVFVDSRGWVWVGTTEKGLNRFDPKTGLFTRYQPSSTKPGSISDAAILALAEDNNGHIWVGTNNGLNRFEAKTNRFSHFFADPGNTDGLSDNTVQALYIDSQQRVWAGTLSGGISVFDGKSQRFYNYQNDPTDSNSLSDQNIQVITGDGKGLIWAGSYGVGLNKFDLSTARFGHQKHIPGRQDSLSPGFVWSFYEDEKESLYVATSQGVSIIHKDARGFEHLTHQRNNPNSLPNPQVRYIAKAPDDRIWFASDGGLSLYDPNSQSFEHFAHNSNDNKSLSSNIASFLLQENNGPLWIGTFGGGLNRFDYQSKTFKRYQFDALDPYSVSSDEISAIFRDSKGILWVATWKGLNRYEQQTGRFIRYEHNPANPGSLPSHLVTSILEDQSGQLWIATYGGGFSRYRRDSDDFVHYDITDGLANNSVNGILEDRHQKLWMSTNAGLSRFDLNTGGFLNFDAKDGLQSNEFNSSAFYQTKDGRLLFGGVNGFNWFEPDDITVKRQAPAVTLTELLLLNRQVPLQSEENVPVQGIQLAQPINQLKQLQLNYRHDLITFEFSALNLVNPEKMRYAYRLVGSDQSWIATDARNRRATYTDLVPGEYVLEVKASNGDGSWSEQAAQLKLLVEPPPWATWWARSLYALLIIAAVAYSYRAHKLSVARAYAISQKLQKVDKLKDEFLANTSHELRTPLNGIIGLAESLMDGAAGQLPDQANRNLSMLVASGKRLANLVNDIMDFSKIKSSHLSVTLKPVDLRAMIEVVLALSRHMSASKGLTLVNAIDSTLPAVNADESRLQQILHNLVGNAIKFTSKGQVVVSAKVTGNWMSICVSDTGIGIPTAHFDRIFESFEQVEGGTDRAYGGTGLGLSLSRKLVELHGGTIEVDSTEGIGSTFRFTLPISEHSAESTDDAQLTSHLHMLPQEWEVMPQSSKQNQVSQYKRNDNARFTILLVDDELVNRQVLLNHLSMQEYQLIEAENGRQAIEAVEKQGPIDLILLDIMMPGMSGYQVCEQIRGHFSVQDLPILFLTAKNQVVDLVHGFEVGANDYLSKPVSKAELLARVDTHLSLLDINRNLEQKVNERTVELKQATDAKSDFLAKMSHEIRTPMNAVIGLSRLVLKSELPGHQCRHVEQILDAGESLLGLINDILDFSKIEAGKLIIEHIEFSLFEVLRKTINLSMLNAHIKGIELVTEVAPNVPEKLIGDPLRLQQIIVNLVNNAVKFTDTGVIIVRISLAEQNTDGCMLQCSVQDTGPGMSPQQQSKLFQNFSQGDDTISRLHGGTGLGLAISRQLSELMGGSIWLQSKEGIGSTFFFTINVEKGSPKDVTSEPCLAALKALVIDDKPSANVAMVNTLKALEVESLTATSGDKAIALLNKNSVDFMVINGQMQQDAIALLSKIRLNCPNAPKHLFTITSYIQEEFQLRSVDSQPHQLLEKPFFAPNLRRAIAQLIDENHNYIDAPNHSIGEVPDFSGSHILLVEDNAINRQVALGFLSDTGAVVICAEDGLLALDKVHHGRFDLVLMDIEMPNMDGLTASRRIRQTSELSALPIIAMTAHASMEAMHEVKVAGMNDYISKPLEPELLYRKLTQYLKVETAHNTPHRSFESTTSIDVIDQLSLVDGLQAARALAKMGGRRNLYLDLVKDFSQAQRKLPLELEALYQQKAWDKLYRTVHSLKSNAAYIGAYTLSEISETVEEAYGNGQHDYQMLEKLSHTLTPLIEQLGTLFEFDDNPMPTSSFDHEQFKQLLAKIAPMLLRSDIAVESCVPQLQSMCIDTEFAAKVDVLVSCIEDLEYEKAAKLVEALNASIGEIA